MPAATAYGSATMMVPMPNGLRCSDDEGWTRQPTRPALLRGGTVRFPGQSAELTKERRARSQALRGHVHVACKASARVPLGARAFSPASTSPALAPRLAPSVGVGDRSIVRLDSCLNSSVLRRTRRGSIATPHAHRHLPRIQTPGSCRVLDINARPTDGLASGTRGVARWSYSSAISRRGFSIVTWSTSCSDRPAARSLGKKASARYVNPRPPK